MPRIIIVSCLALLACLLLWPQSQRAPSANVTTWEYKVLLPQETTPGQFAQVQWNDVQSLGNQGWELVGVTSYVIHNDERPGENMGMPVLVTQNYQAFYFKRPRAPQR
jgi:hypothetical protein